MDLKADEALQLAIRSIIVNHHTHHAAVQDLQDRVPTSDYVKIVPVITFDDALEFRTVAERTDGSRLLAFGNITDLPPECEEASSRSS